MTVTYLLRIRWGRPGACGRYFIAFSALYPGRRGDGFRNRTFNIDVYRRLKNKQREKKEPRIGDKNHKRIIPDNNRNYFTTVVRTAPWINKINVRSR